MRSLHTKILTFIRRFALPRFSLRLVTALPCFPRPRLHSHSQLERRWQFLPRQLVPPARYYFRHYRSPPWPAFRFAAVLLLVVAVESLLVDFRCWPVAPLRQLVVRIFAPRFRRLVWTLPLGFPQLALRVQPPRPLLQQN